MSENKVNVNVGSIGHVDHDKITAGLVPINSNSVEDALIAMDGQKGLISYCGHLIWNVTKRNDIKETINKSYHHQSEHQQFYQSKIHGKRK